MTHIQLPHGLPGIRGPMVFSPETSKPLCDLVQVLLTGPHSLTRAEREMIATMFRPRMTAFTARAATVQPRHNTWVDEPLIMS